MNVGAGIKWVRKSLSITQHELAAKARITQATLSQIESGSRNPGPTVIKKIAAVLDIPEPILYLISIRDADVPESKKQVFKMIFPIIKDLALQIVDSDLREKIKNDLPESRPVVRRVRAEALEAV